MKTCTLFIKTSILGLLLSAPAFSNAQEWIKNGNFNDKTGGWESKEIIPEVNPETIYGGKDDNNLVAEIDAAAGLQQQLVLKSNAEYFLVFDGSRRIDKETPEAPGISVQVIGTETGISYMQKDIIFKNTEFVFEQQVISFAIPSDAKDKSFYLQFSGYNNKTTMGVIVDNIELKAFGILPLQFVSFAGSIHNNQAVLNWITSNEVNNDFFTIEASSNGHQFDSIGRVNHTGGNSNKKYQYTDINPKTGIFYYRLVQTDMDGQRSYSKIITINWQGNHAANIKLYPTIANQTINFQLTGSQKSAATIRIFDASGKIMMLVHKPVSADTKMLTADISGLRNGCYFVRLDTEDSSISFTQAFQKTH